MKPRSRQLGKAHPAAGPLPGGDWWTVYAALVPIPCSQCQAEIEPGAWFTYTAVPRPGRHAVCRTCRDFEPATFDARGPLIMLPAQAARHLGMSTPAFRREVRAAGNPGLVGPGLRYDRLALEAWRDRTNRA